MFAPTVSEDENSDTQEPNDLHEVYTSVADSDPDKTAKLLDLAQKTGQSPQDIYGNEAEVSKIAVAPTREQFVNIKKQHPIVGDFLSDPSKMAIAYDDTDNLVAHSHANKQIEAGHGLADAVAAGLENSILGMEFRGKTADTALSPDASFAEKFTGSAAQFAADFPYMAAGGAIGGVIGLPAGPVGSAIAGYGMAFALPDAYREALRQHYDEGDVDSAVDILKKLATVDAIKKGIKGFGIGALTGGAGLAVKAAGAGLGVGLESMGKIATGAVKVSGKVAALGTAAEIGTMTTVGAIAEGKRPEAADLATNALLVGLMHGAGVVGGYGLDRAFPDRVADTIRVDATRDGAELLDEASKASKLRARDPRAFEDLMNKGKPVMIPVEAYEKYFQSKGIDPEQVSQDLGVSESHEIARQTGGDVVIPQGKYLSPEMDAHRSGLIDDIKFNQDHFTANELKDIKQASEDTKKIQQEFIQKQGDISEKLVKTDTSIRQMHEQIMEDARSKLESKVPVDMLLKDKNKWLDANSRIVANHYVAEGSRRGEPALDLYTREFPTIAGAGPAEKGSFSQEAGQAAGAQFPEGGTPAGEPSSPAPKVAPIPPEVSSIISIDPNIGDVKAQADDWLQKEAQARGMEFNEKFKHQFGSFVHRGINRLLKVVMDEMRKLPEDQRQNFLETKMESHPATAAQRLLRAKLDSLREAYPDIVANLPHTIDEESKALEGFKEMQQPPESLKQENAPTFYSKMQQDLDTKIQGSSATPDQVRAIIRDAKEDERKWSGIDEFLKDKTKIDKSELMEFLKLNQLQIKEFEKGKIDPSSLSGSELQKEYVKQTGGNPLGKSEESMRSAITMQATKYDEYQLSGGENYRELLLALPDAEGNINEHPEIQAITKRALYASNLVDEAETAEEYEVAQKNYLAILDEKKEQIGQLRAYQNKPDTFESSHFDEPNILAHIRFNDRIDSEGKKILFLEELQSDWHQKGRRQGYAGKPLSPQERSEWMKLTSGDTSKLTDEQRARALELLDRENPADRVPDAPFKKTWHEFALKRMLRYAAENGYDKLGWTTGEQQAERYDLSKQVKNIQWEKNDDGTFNINAPKPDGSAGIYREDLKLEEVGDLVGKDIADKIVAGEGREDMESSYRSWRVIEGDGLKIGGHGMAGFYDKIIPSFLNKFGKKFSAKVGNLTTRDSENGDLNSHALPITPELKRAALNEGFPLFQGAKGEYVPKLNEIRLNKNSDASTFMHEFSHGALEHMFDFVKSGQATQDYLDHFSAVKDFLKIGDDQTKLTTEQHEKFARAWERYLRGEDTQEGATKAPTPELKSAFNMFRKWLTNVYRQIKGSPLEGELTSEVRGFFDRMVATDDQIVQAAQEAGYKDGEIASLEGIDPATEDRHRTIQQRARDQAENTLLKEQMADVRALDKAKLDSERQKAMERLAPEVADHPLYKAMSDVEENRPGAQRSAASLADDFIAGKLSEQEQGAFEAAAEVHGFSDGRDLAESIKADSEAGGQASTLMRRVDDAMSAYENPDPIKQRESALKAIHETRMTELLALEQEILSGMQHDQEVRSEVAKRRKISASIAAANAKDQAKAYLESRPLREAGAFRSFVTAERNAAVRVSKAIAEQDYAKAAEAKGQQMLNHALAAEAMRNRTEINRKGKFLDKFIKRGQDMMNMPYGFITKIDDMLVQHGLMNPRDTTIQQTLITNAESMAASGSDPAEIANATGLIQGSDGKWSRESLPEFVSRVNDNYYPISLPDSVMMADAQGLSQANPNMSLADFRDLHEAVKIVNQVGKGFERFLSDFIKGDIKTNAAAFRDQVAKNIGTPHGNGPVLGELDMNKLEKAVTAIKSMPDNMIASKVNLLTLCEYLDRLDPNGEAKKNIYRPLRGAENLEREMRHQKAQELETIREKYYDKKEISKMSDESFSKWQIQTPDGPKDVRLTKENALVLFLNRGSESNLDRITRGFGITPEQVKNITDGLSKKDHDFAQEIWRYVDTLWPQASQLEMDVNGVEPVKVKPIPVESVHGTYEGGYYPLSYDFTKSADAYKNAEQRNALYKQYSTAAAHTEQGALKERVKTLDRPVRLTFDGLFNHLDDVIHDISYRKSVIDVSRFLNQPDAKNAIINAIGIDGYKKIGDDLKAAASSQVDFMTPTDRRMRWFRFATTFATLGYRVSIFPRRITEDVVNAMREVGFKNTVGAVADYVMNPQETRDFVQQNIPVMRERAITRERDLMDMSNEWKGRNSKIRMFAFLQDTIADQALSYPVASAVYKANVDKYGPEMASQIAGESIIKTFGSGSQIDRVGAQRGSELSRLISMYYSWHSMMFNRAWLQGKIAGLEYNEGNYGKAIAVIAATTATSWAIPAATDIFWHEVLHNAPNGQETDEEKGKRRLAKFLEAPFAYFPMARNVAALAIPHLIGEKARDYKLSPVEDAVESVVKGVSDSVHSMFDPDKEFDKKTAEEATRAASIMLGMPNQLNMMMMNYKDYLDGEGEYTWRDLVSRRTKK